MLEFADIARVRLCPQLGRLLLVLWLNMDGLPLTYLHHTTISGKLQQLCHVNSACDEWWLPPFNTWLQDPYVGDRLPRDSFGNHYRGSGCTQLVS